MRTTVLLLLAVTGAALAQFNRQQSPEHFQNGGSAYNLSWRNTGRNVKWAWNGADNYCRSLGRGWQQISIDDQRENNMVSNILQQHGIEYIWTSGTRRGNGWSWGSGQPVRNIGWSHTGGSRRAQPDNREGNEACLAVLNNFYGDGVKWHDVACHHQKPTICEQNLSFRG